MHKAATSLVYNPMKKNLWWLVIDSACFLLQSGKSAAIYACARDQGFQIIEVPLTGKKKKKSLSFILCKIDAFFAHLHFSFQALI